MTPDLDLCLTAQKLKILHYVTLQKSCGSAFLSLMYSSTTFFTRHDILLITYHFIVNATEQALKDELYPEYVLCLFPLLSLYLRIFYKSQFILEMASYTESDKV